MTENKSSDTGATSKWYVRMRDLLKGEPASREELLEMFSKSRLESALDSDEITMLQGVLKVADTQVRDVMIPRAHMVVLEQDAATEEILNTIIQCGHSRLPVIGEDRDEVVGILLAKDILRFFVETPDEEFQLSRWLRPATFIPESKRLNALLKEFRNSRNHMAIVVDEYGGTAGLLTIEDVLEEIVGEIDDEHDPQEAEPIQQINENQFRVQALTRMEEFNEFFTVGLDDEDYDTIGGLVMHELGRLPRRGDEVLFGGFQFKVLNADRRRIHSVEVSRAVRRAED